MRRLARPPRAPPVAPADGLAPTAPSTAKFALLAGQWLAVALGQGISNPVALGPALTVPGPHSAAHDSTTGEKVSIKKISAPFKHTLACRRTLREITIMRQLDHDNVLGVTDLMPVARFEELHDVYIVTPLMDSDLHAVLSSPTALSLDHVRYFAYQVRLPPRRRWAPWPRAVGWRVTHLAPARYSSCCGVSSTFTPPASFTGISSPPTSSSTPTAKCASRTLGSLARTLSVLSATTLP